MDTQIEMNPTEAEASEVEVIEAEVVETPTNGDAEIVTDVEEAPIEEAVEETADVEAVEEVVEPLVFADDATIEQIVEQGTQALDKYEIPEDVKSYIDILQTQATKQPEGDYSEFGTVDEVKTLLDRESFLNTSRQEGERIRPNTDKFVESLDGDRASWLAYDLNAMPSTKYDGYTRFEETLVDNIAIEGDTVQQTLDRYHQFMQAMKENALPSSDMPEFVPSHLKEAYYKLSAARRDTMMYLDPMDDAQTIKEHLADLELVQRGLDGERADKQRLAQIQNETKARFEGEVIDTQNKFFSTLRDQFAADVSKEIKFSDDAKTQSLLANQQVTLIMQAFDEGAAGDFARKTLADAGITFDHTQGQSLLNETQIAAIDLVRQKNNVDSSGKPLDNVALKRAESNYEKVSRKWVKLAKSTLDSMARVAATGKTEDVQKQAEKIKLAPKARVAPSGQATQAKKTELVSPHPYNSPEDLAWWADRRIEEQAKRAAAYQ